MHKAKSTEEQGNRGRFPFSFPPAKHPAALRGPRIAASEYGNIFRTVFFLRTFAKRSLAWYNVCKFRARVFAACAGSIL